MYAHMFDLYVRFEEKKTTASYLDRIWPYSTTIFVRRVCVCLECLCYEMLLCVHFLRLFHFLRVLCPPPSLAHLPSNNLLCCETEAMLEFCRFYIHIFFFSLDFISVFIILANLQVFFFLKKRSLDASSRVSFSIDCFNNILSLHIFASILIYFKYTKISSVDEVAEQQQKKNERIFHACVCCLHSVSNHTISVQWKSIYVFDFQISDRLR